MFAACQNESSLMRWRAGFEHELQIKNKFWNWEHNPLKMFYSINIHQDVTNPLESDKETCTPN